MTDRLKELHRIRDIEEQLAEAQQGLKKVDVEHLFDEARDYALKVISAAKR